MKKGLGRGLDALFEDNVMTGEAAEKETEQLLRLTEIEPDKNQPRKHFDEEKLTELSESIKQHGIIQPIIVRKTANGRYSIIAGERRWRAARMAGLSEVPAIVREYDEQQAREIALIENLQREDLNPVEEANGYKTLMDQYSLTQEQIASIVGKSRPVVANALRLLNLPGAVLGMLESEDISAGHARALLSFNDPETAEKIAKRIKKEDLTVRDVEKLAKGDTGKKMVCQQLSMDSGDMVLIQKKIEEALGRKIKIVKNKAKGRIEIEFYDNNDFDALVTKLTGENELF